MLTSLIHYFSCGKPSKYKTFPSRKCIWKCLFFSSLNELSLEIKATSSRGQLIKVIFGSCHPSLADATPSSYRQTSNIRCIKSQNVNVSHLVCSCFWSVHWSQVSSGGWRCSWSSADRRCSNYIWLIFCCISPTTHPHPTHLNPRHTGLTLAKCCP